MSSRRRYPSVHNRNDGVYRWCRTFCTELCHPHGALIHVCGLLLPLQDSSPTARTYPSVASNFPQSRRRHKPSRSMSSSASSGSRSGPMQVTLPLVPCPRCGDEIVTAICRHGTRPGVRFYKCCHYSVRFLPLLSLFFPVHGAATR
jgi:hypothetical protein